MILRQLPLKYQLLYLHINQQRTQLEVHLECPLNFQRMYQPRYPQDLQPYFPVKLQLLCPRFYQPENLLKYPQIILQICRRNSLQEILLQFQVSCQHISQASSPPTYLVWNRLKYPQIILQICRPNSLHEILLQFLVIYQQISQACYQRNSIHENRQISPPTYQVWILLNLLLILKHKIRV
jgi:hypothetical protein